MISGPGKVGEIVASEHACGGAVVLAYIERDEDRLDAGVQNNARGFRIRPDVVFRKRSDVARGDETSAKEHEALKGRAEPRFLKERHCKIRHRACRDEGYLSGRSKRLRQYEIDGVPLDWPNGWSWRRRIEFLQPVAKLRHEPLLEMDRGFHVGLGIADDGTPSAGGDRNVLAPG